MQSSHDNSIDSRVRNPFRSVSSTYRSVATPESVKSQSTDEKEPLQMIKVKVEKTTPVKSSDHYDDDDDTKGKRNSEHDIESNLESDDVTVIQ